MKERLFAAFGGLGVIMALLMAPPLWAAEAVKVPDPSPHDTCPVCGMFVAKYPEWIATVVYKDGHAHHFDGAKDLFKFLQNVPKYAKGHSAKEIVIIAVTEYYGLTRIDAHTAFFVIGSDVLGPMGHELIPLASEQDAREFMADHKGRAIVRFKDVTPEVIRRLDQ